MIANNVDPYDISALERSLNESAVRASTLWITYLLFGLYLIIAAVNVTPRQLFLSEPIKLPVLNIDLPIVGFFFLAPVLFVILHAYVLLQLVLLARTAAVYNDAVNHRILNKTHRDQVRQRLANTLFAQIVAGSSRERGGLLGKLLQLMAWVALVIGPLFILIIFEIKFLPYHSHIMTWFHRLLITVDILAILLLWPGALDGTKDIRWHELAHNWKSSVTAISFVFLFCILSSFPGEPHAGWSRYTAREVNILAECGLRSVVQAILPPNFDRLVLSGEDFVDDEKLSKMEAVARSRHQQAFEGDRTHIFSGRDFNCANFEGTDLRRVDFGAANIIGAKFDAAQLQGTSFKRARLQRASLKDATLQGASFAEAELEGAVLIEADLLGAVFDNADLRSADFSRAKLYDASVSGARLQGASFEYAGLNNAFLVHVQMQGVSFVHAALYAARFKDAQLQGANFNDAGLQGAVFQDVKLDGASFARARLQGAAFVGDTTLDLVDLSGTFLWHTDSSNCNAAHVVSPKVEPVIGWKKNGMDFLLATPEDIEVLVGGVTNMLPQSSMKFAQSRLRDRLSPERTQASSDFWLACAAAALPVSDYDAKLAKYLADLACNQAENDPSIAEGIIRSRIRYATTFGDNPVAQTIARMLLGTDGRRCPGAKHVNEADREFLLKVAVSGNAFE